MKNEVFWKNPGYKPRPSLKQDIECDYLIVGGGIMGVSLAYFLNKLGAKNIVLIEKNTVGSGATGKSAGFLALKGELDILQIMNKYGKEKGLLFWKANKDGLETIKKIVKKEKINCDFEVENTIFGSIYDNIEQDYVLKEYVAEKSMEKKSELLVGEQLRKEIHTPLFLYALKSYGHGISVNPLKLIQKLSEKIEKKGVKVYENTRLSKIQKNSAITPSGKIKFKKIILAIDTRLKDSRIKALRSTITMSQKLNRTQLKEMSLLQRKMIWDDADVYHYLKVTKDNRIMLGYGDKKIRKTQPNASAHDPHVKKIRTFYKELFPRDKIKIEYAWSGNFGVTNDRVPIIEEKGSRIKIGGAASQVICIISTKHLAHKLLGKSHYLNEFFKNLKRSDPKLGLFDSSLGLLHSAQKVRREYFEK